MPAKRERNKLRQELSAVMDFLRNQLDVVNATLKAKGEKDTDERFGRLDALNRIGNQVFYTDLAAGGLSGYKRIFTPTMRRSVSRRSGPCGGCCGRNMTARSSSR
jgi:hypothetical protein